jgi:hypothetical protein
MAGGSKLNRREQALAALLAEPTLERAAAKAGISLATIKRWLSDPEFQGAFRAARRQLVENAVTRLQQITTAAVATLYECQSSGPPAVRVRAAAAGLKPGDVLLRYGGAELAAAEDLSRQVAARAAGRPVTLALWREGQTSERTVPAGNLGVAVASDPAPVALAKKRTTGDGPAPPGGGEGWPPLPGTRAEVAALGRLFADTQSAPTLLTGPDASEKKLDELAGSEALGGFRYLHLATHGIADDHFPLRSAVILALDDPNRPDAGRLSAEKILRTWQLHTDLVTLSACQTALGKHEVGEGFIGFAQALILAGSRSVCLSLWKVDDTATALFMERFYQNLLGRREGLKGPLPKAAALAEAKAWLRNLSREEALKRADSLSEGAARGKGRPVLPLLPALPPPAAGAKEQRPYAHPYYWAAFVLIGDGD